MGKTVFVTGAASGIGRSVARAHAARGDRVIAADLSADSLDQLVDDGIEPWVLDVTDARSVEQAAGQIWTACSGVDWVYVNAGIGAPAPLLEASREQFRKCLEVNLIGAWMTLKAFASRMVKADRPGRLCVTASEHSLGFQHAGAGIYTASKHALLGLCDVLRHELDKNLVVVAPTGVAALNVQGQTIHSLFQLPPGPQPRAKRIAGAAKDVVEAAEEADTDAQWRCPLCKTTNKKNVGSNPNGSKTCKCGCVLEEQEPVSLARQKNCPEEEDNTRTAEVAVSARAGNRVRRRCAQTPVPRDGSDARRQAKVLAAGHVELDESRSTRIARRKSRALQGCAPRSRARARPSRQRRKRGASVGRDASARTLSLA